MVDGVLQLAVVGAVPRGDGLPGSVNHNITQGALKAGPMFLLTTLDLWKTSTMARHSTRPGRGTLLIMN
jgi:hypothetical protein